MHLKIQFAYVTVTQEQQKRINSSYLFNMWRQKMSNIYISKNIEKENNLWNFHSLTTVQISLYIRDILFNVKQFLLIIVNAVGLIVV